MTAPRSIVKGTKFISPRKSEGLVTAVCDYGACRHDTSRPESVHVRGVYDTSFGPTRSEFFINFPASWPVEEWGAEVVS